MIAVATKEQLQTLDYLRFGLVKQTAGRPFIVLRPVVSKVLLSQRLDGEEWKYPY